jgi:hypothetical protein
VPPVAMLAITIRRSSFTNLINVLSINKSINQRHQKWNSM